MAYTGSLIWKNRHKLAQRLLERREIDSDTGCWVYTGHWSKQGHGIIYLGHGKNQKSLLVHRVAAIIWKKWWAGNCVAHRFASCPLSCFNPEHLKRFDNRSQVMSFAKKLHRWDHGLKAYWCNLPAEVIRFVRAECDHYRVLNQWIVEAVRKRFGVNISIPQVSKIRRGLTYRSVV